MRSTFNVLFYLNTSKKKKSGCCPVMGRITVDGSMNFFVEDTGSGIYNDDNFGMTIAHGLVHQMGGKMEVEFQENAGMSVDFNIMCYPCEIFEN